LTVGVTFFATWMGQEDVQRRLQQSEDTVKQLREENNVLKESVKRKDATIAQLLRDAESSPVGVERFSKTESTSRESDHHLRDRDISILQRKNRKLQKALKAKQKTITDLHKLLGQVLEGGGGFTTGGGEEDEDGGASSDGVAAPAPQHIATGSQGRPNRMLATRADPKGDSGSEPEEIKEEMRELAGKLARLERDVEGLSLVEQGVAARPTTGGGGRGGLTVAGGGAAPGLLAPAEIHPTTNPSSQQRLVRLAAAQAAMPVAQAVASQFQPPVRTGGAHIGTATSLAAGALAVAPPPLSKGSPQSRIGSTMALQALADELELLEEKKRVVEQLAKTLEPASDAEEDDGFPLR